MPFKNKKLVQHLFLRRDDAAWARIEKGSVIPPSPLSPSSAQASSLCVPLQARALLWAHPDFPRTHYRWPSVVTWSCSVLDVSFLSPRALPLLNAVYCLSSHLLIHLYIPSLSAPQTPPGLCVPEPSSECWVLDPLSSATIHLVDSCLFHLPTFLLSELWRSKLQPYMNFNYFLFSLVAKKHAAKWREETML